MTVALPTELERFVTQLVASGRYSSPEAAFAAALTLLREKEELRAEVLAGVEQADRGQTAPFSAAETLARIRAKRQTGVVE